MYEMPLEEFNALRIAIECGLVPRIKDDEFDVTKFNEFWCRYTESREKIRKREVKKMLAYKKERYRNKTIALVCTFIGVLLVILGIIVPK